jgi:uncharacterized membrane protein YecN with MAPEG domain
MTIPVICTSLLGLLLFTLGCAVTLQRRRSRTYFGGAVDPSDWLYRLVRAHGNTAEHAPMLCVLMLLAAQRAPSTWVGALSALVCGSRYLQVVGMLWQPTADGRPNWFRLLGTPGTYVGGALLCLAILVRP